MAGLLREQPPSYTRRPLERHAFVLQPALEPLQLCGLFPHCSGRLMRLESECRQRAGRLADVPLHRVQAVAAIGDVRGAEVLRASDEICYPHGDKRPQGNLEWFGAAARADIV